MHTTDTIDFEFPTDEEVDQLTFDFEKTAGGADLMLRWMQGEVRVPMAAAP